MADWVSISLQGLLAKLADTKTSLSHIRTSYPSNLMALGPNNKSKQTQICFHSKLCDTFKEQNA